MKHTILAIIALLSMATTAIAQDVLLVKSGGETTELRLSNEPTMTIGEKITVTDGTTTKSFDKSQRIVLTTNTPVSPILVTGITLSATTANLTIGDSKTLTATVAPANADNKEVTWSSSNTSVATVSSTGVVTAVGVGTATITCMAKDGSNKKATCVVTVKAPDPVLVTGITLSATTATLTIGDSKALTATVSPSNADNKEVTWYSSNSAIATVSSTGVVTAVSAGTATITATAKDGSGKKATCVVTVNPILVTGVSLSATTASLNVGGTKTLTATVTPTNADNKDVTWTSSNTAVATVDNNGKVTAVSAGSATITATAKDGSNKKATCVVTVKVATVPVSAMDISRDYVNLKVGETYNFKTEITPDDATDKSVKFSSSNKAVATVSSTGELTAVSKGDATITVSANGGTSITKTCSVHVFNDADPFIRITDDRLTMHVGETHTFDLDVNGMTLSSGDVTWMCNSKIGTIDSNGNFTATALGESIIVVYAMNGVDMVADQMYVNVVEGDPEPSYAKGDVNHDGKVDHNDVKAVITVICGDNKYKNTADVNKDSKINILDVNTVIGIICGK